MPISEPRYRTCFAIGMLLTSALLFAWLFWNVLHGFAFVYTDMDQSILWYGAHEFSSGRFHQPRFFGQAYGSMLESMVAVPLLFLPVHKALVCATSLLFLLPYALIGRSANDRLNGFAVVVFFLSVMPATYLMLGTMPRDFVSGIAVASLSIPSLDRRGKWSYLWVGLFAILGWSTNHGAALLGATVVTYKLLGADGTLIKRSAFLIVGMAIAMIIHLGSAYFFAIHPEYVVHHAWDFSYYFKQLRMGISNMDMHWGRIAPFFKDKGWIYILLFALLVYGSHVQRNSRAFGATIVLCVLTLLSFGVLKVHDGFNSIFSSYERMYLALPVAVCLLLTKVRIVRWAVPPLAAVAILFTGMHLATFDEVLASEFSEDRDHLVAIATTEGVYERMAQIKAVADEVGPDGILIGPDADWLAVHASSACFLINDSIPIVYPKYERKTWDMRRMDQPGFAKILWITDVLEVPDDAPYAVVPIVRESAAFKAFVLTGDNLDPLAIYRSLGHAVSAH